MLELVGSNYGDGSATTWRYSRRNNTKTTFLEIFIGYHFITARKVSSAISRLNVCENVTGCIDISLPERPEV